MTLIRAALQTLGATVEIDVLLKFGAEEVAVETMILDAVEEAVQIDQRVFEAYPVQRLATRAAS